jgi:hypothetical protein
MKKYFLTIISGNKINYDHVKDIGFSISEIIDSERLKFSYNESFIMFSFNSSVDKKDMFVFIEGVLYGFSDMFTLTEVNDNFSVSLPKKMKYIFDIEDGNIEEDLSNSFIKEDEEEEYDVDIEDEFYEDIMEVYRKTLKNSIPKITLDSLLDKIIETGIDSLNDVERELLENYSK